MLTLYLDSLSSERIKANFDRIELITSILQNKPQLDIENKYTATSDHIKILPLLTEFFETFGIKETKDLSVLLKDFVKTLYKTKESLIVSLIEKSSKNF